MNDAKQPTTKLQLGLHSINFKLNDFCIYFINRYMNGAASNPDAHAFAHAAAQVKKGLEIGKKLGAENFGTFVHSIFFSIHSCSLLLCLFGQLAII